MKRTFLLGLTSAALITGLSTAAYADDDIGFRNLPGIVTIDLGRWHGGTLYRIDDDDDDGWRPRGVVRGHAWRDDDDDDGRRGYHSRWDDDDDDGRRGRWRNDDDD